MANINFSSLTDDGKVIFFLGLSEKVLSVFSQKEDQILAEEVISKYWKWLKDKENIGDLLYELLDNEENGITIIQEMADNETDILAWNCVIDAVAYTSRKAFEREGVKYFPEPIALVDDTLVEHFLDCFEGCIEKLTTAERITAGSLAAAGFIPVVGWAGRAIKGGKTIHTLSKGAKVTDHALDAYQNTKAFDILRQTEYGIYGLASYNGFSEYITGKDMFGNELSEEKRNQSLTQGLFMLGIGGASVTVDRMQANKNIRHIFPTENPPGTLPKLPKTWTINNAMTRMKNLIPEVRVVSEPLTGINYPVFMKRSGGGTESLEGVRKKGGGKNQEITKFTEEQLLTKPRYSRDPEKWLKKGGKIEISEEGTWTYIDWEVPPNRVSYPGGFPDFKSAGLVRQEVQIGEFKRYDTDFQRADELAPNGAKLDENTWHHHQDLTTMQEVNKKMHRRFRHMGGMSLTKKQK